ncbi:hypothetical protein WMY93_028406 [Mugilogobius chulae]|uniref:Uncharacterized protein n=1 Tax=Mugilogobius chulae TaxID=88201 RepID=A0AAW0MN70_9GOBI
MLLLEDLVEVAFDFMLSHMSPENCFVIWKFSAVVVSTKTRDSARRLTLENFEELSVCEDFYDLTAQELMDFFGGRTHRPFQRFIRGFMHHHIIKDPMVECMDTVALAASCQPGLGFQRPSCLPSAAGADIQPIVSRRMTLKLIE